LIEEHMKILKFMSEMTSRIDLNEFAKNLGLTSSQVMQDMQALTKDGFLKKAGGGFGITEKGKTALKTVAPIAGNLSFSFYLAVDKPTGMSAGSIKEFFDVILKVAADSLEFHLYRGDFENWFKTAVSDASFSEELTNIKKMDLKGEELRKAIAKALELRYSL
jgi:DNA-binding Lrp family transcriptional regulator